MDKNHQSRHVGENSITVGGRSFGKCLPDNCNGLYNDGLKKRKNIQRFELYIGPKYMVCMF